MRPGAGRADGEGPGDAAAVPPHGQRPPVGLQPDLQPGAGGQLRRDDGPRRARRTQGPEAGTLRAADARPVVRYREVLDEALALGARQCAVLPVLLLRGHQPIGELRIPPERMTTFDSL